MTATTTLESPTCDLGKDVLLVQIPGDPDVQWMARLESKYPGFRVKWVPLCWTPGDKASAGAVMSPETWAGVTMAVLFLPQPAHLMSQVRYVQLTSAGADKWVGHEAFESPNVVFCTANGIHPPQIAEWVIGTYLMMSHHFLDYANVQKQASWSETLFDTQDSPGLRMGILGYGAIGRQCGRLASAMGMEVYAFTRRERPTPALRRADPASYCLPGTGDPDGLIPNRWFHGTSRGAVNEFLAQDLDVLVVSLPLARDTASSSSSIIGREQFEILARKRTFVSNVARGRHVDTEALLEALRRGQIRGAALDVTDPEPLPPGHPLFSAPNVFITPHVSWRSPSYFERVLGLLEANLEILNTGGQLLNVVDKTL